VNQHPGSKHNRLPLSEDLIAASAQLGLPRLLEVPALFLFRESQLTVPFNTMKLVIERGRLSSHQLNSLIC
jgi:hypothetical protein